jgi:hypothetical protein
MEFEMPTDETNQPQIDLACLRAEPEQVYHARRGEYLSSHLLADFRKSPLLYHKRVDGLIEDKDSSAYLVGRAAHVRILEGNEKYESAFAFGGPVNPRTGRPFGSNTKAFSQWAADQGKPVLTDSQAEIVERLAEGVAMNPSATELMLDGQAEGVVRSEYCGQQCQIRIDWLNRHHGIVDLKTCDDLTWFEADARRYGYVHQMAFYQSVLSTVLNGTMVPVHIIAIEKKEPYRCGVWRVSEASLKQAQVENAAAICRLHNCRRQGSWPTGYEGVRVLEAI